MLARNRGGLTAGRGLLATLAIALLGCGLGPTIGEDTASDLLESGIVAEVFGVADSEIEFQTGQDLPHSRGTARWNRPGKAEREAACRRARDTFARLVFATGPRGRALESPEPRCTVPEPTAELRLEIQRTESGPTEIIAGSFEVSDASLEDGSGVSPTNLAPDGQTGDPIDGIGDKAVWSPALRRLSVVASGTSFNVTVRGLGEAEARDKTLEVARRVIEAL